MSPVESRALRYFVAVAEELNFGRAAERLGMTQPPLSRAIRRLETQMGARLLERSTRAVALTPAGEVLLDEARVALAALDGAVRRAAHAARPRHTLTVALKPDLDGGLLPAIIAAYEQEQTTVPVEVLLCGYGQQAQAVRDGRADVALATFPFDQRGLDLEVLMEEPQVAAITPGHRLASRSALRLADLEAEPLLNRTQHLGPTARTEERDPAMQPPDGIAHLLKMVELGQICAILPVSVAARYPRAQIAYRPLVDAGPATLAVTWPEATSSLAVAAFVRAAVDTAARTAGADEVAGGAPRGARAR